ncbi:MAG: OmpH family outer membrane protein [Acidobacteriota bacterium]|nr:OmpH family outer membrane protein [Acidobacteriota bacterium]
MKLKSVILPLAGLLGSIAVAQTSPAASPAAATPGTAATAPPSAMTAPSKVAVIDIQAAIIQTKDGQKAAAELKTKFGPKQSELEKKQSDIAQLQQTLSKGSNTLSDEAKQKTMREIDAKNTTLKRDTEDANADLEQEQQRIMGDLGGKMISVLNKFATDNGYALVLDISSQQTPVLFASNTIDVTRDIIALYDKSAGTLTAPAGAQRNSVTPRPTSPVRK